MNYTKHVSTKATPQSQPIPGTAQVKNSAGGFTFKVDDWARLDRFLILGTEGGSYYASEKKLTVTNAEAVIRCIKADGLRTVARIAEVSHEGRAPKNDQAIFALAMATKLGDEPTRKAAAAAVSKVCRIGTHIFQYAEAIKAFGGWGRVTARAVSNWYNEQPADKLALNLVKYANRNGWTHKDLLSKSHAGAGAPDAAHAALYRYIVKDGDLSARAVTRKKGAKVFSEAAYPALSREALPRIIEGCEKVREKGISAKQVAKLISEYDLPREVVPTEALNSVEVWDALLHAGKFGMPLTALVRNLGKMSSIGLIAPLSDAARFVVSKLKDEAAIKAARVHPISLLIAQRIYAQGHGEKGSLKWTAVSPVVDALDAAFYLGFKAVEPTNKRWLLALDISGSMGGGSVAGSPLTPREASAAMALVTANVESDYHMVGYTSSCPGSWMPSGGASNRASRGMYGGGNNYAILPLDLSPRMRLKDVCAKVERLPMGGTDCALPVLYALEKKIPVDVFVSYTDSETWAGQIHCSQALKMYRDQMGIPAKLIACGMVANEYSVVDPNDAGSLDVVGFDTSTPAVMAAFAQS